jgi:hypothetical protein
MKNKITPISNLNMLPNDIYIYKLGRYIFTTRVGSNFNLPGAETQRNGRLDFTLLDQRLGSKAELRQLTERAHQLGLYVPS